MTLALPSCETDAGSAAIVADAGALENVARASADSG